jgi:hypothetical protein
LEDCVWLVLRVKCVIDLIYEGMVGNDIYGEREQQRSQLKWLRKIKIRSSSVTITESNV